MAAVPAAVLDPARLAAVRSTGLLDTPSEEPFDELARLAATLLRAPFAFVTLVDETRSFWKSAIGVDAADPADRQNPVEQSFCQYVVGTSQPLIVGDAAADARTCDNPSIELMGVAAWAGFPVFAREGHVLGSFCVVDTVVRDWSERDVEVLGALSRSVASEFALRAESARSSALARTLQESLLPPQLPAVAGLQTAACYRSAGAGTDVVGDFYDVFEAGSGGCWVVIGDVCGKGVQAAKLTALAHYTIRAAALQCDDPAAVLALLNDALIGQCADQPTFLTAILARVRVSDRRAAVTICVAGHPPALVLRAAGALETIQPTGGLLGLFADAALGCAEIVLEQGDALVLYTDGVIEARRDGALLGEDGLRRALCGTRGLDARGLSALVDETAAAFSPGPPADDVAVVVLRVGG